MCLQGVSMRGREREKIKDLAHFYYWENLEDNFHTQCYCMECLLNELFP